MGNFINKLEDKFGRYAIPRLPLIMIICYGVGYLMRMINPAIAYSISLAIILFNFFRLYFKKAPAEHPTEETEEQ